MKSRKNLINMVQSRIAFFLFLMFMSAAFCGCGGDDGGGTAALTGSRQDVTSIDTRSYMPLSASGSLVYSDGDRVYEAKNLGEIDAAGVRATIYGTEASNNLFNVDSDSINLCGSKSAVFDRPIALFSKKNDPYGLNTTSVTIGGQKTNISSSFAGSERISTGAGTFDALRFQLIYYKNDAGDIDYTRDMYLAKNVGLVMDRVSANGRDSVMTLISGNTGSAVYSRQKKEWALLIYSCGRNPSNDLSKYLYDQLKRFENTGIGKNAYVVAQIVPTNAVLSGYATRFSLDDDRLTTVRTISDRTVNTGSTSEIMSFYNWAIDAYPAEHYALFISGHGSGAISILYPGDAGAPRQSIAYDDTAKDSLKLYELSETYRSVTAKLGKKIDVIVYDSCVMQMVEVAHQLKDFADYFVASQAALAGKGVDTLEFSKKFNASSDHSALAVSKMLVDAYIDSTYITDANLTMSVTKLSMCDRVRTLVDSFAAGMSEIKSDTDSVAFLMAVYGAQRFGSLDYNDYSSCYIDLFDFAATLATYIDAGPARAAAQSLIDIQNEKSFVVYSRVRGDYFKASKGISIFMPKFSKDWVNSNYTREQYRYFIDFGRDGKWYDFLNDWSALLGANGL